MNQRNLLKLAEFLETQLTDEEFHIKYYAYFRGELPSVFKWAEVRGNRGVLRCAIGCIPEALEVDIDTYDGAPYWSSLCSEYLGVKEHSRLGRYMFSVSWEDHDATRMGAVRRIRQVAEGFKPEKSDFPFRVYL